MDQSEEMGSLRLFLQLQFLGRHSVSASVRSHYPAFTQVQCQRRGTKEQIAENYHDGAGRHAA